MPRPALARLTAFLLSPWVLALPAAIIVILLLPFRFPKYSLEIANKEKNVNGHVLEMFDDLDGNGSSDRMFVFNSQVNNCGVSVSMRPSNHSQEWDFPGRYQYESSNFIVTGDSDGDGCSEIYVLSIAGDSLLLNIVPGAGRLDSGYRTVLVSRLMLRNGLPHLITHMLPLTDLDGDGRKELIFAASNGYARCPRRIFIYHPDRDTLRQTPELGINIQDLKLVVMDPGKRKILLLPNYASTNIPDSGGNFHDQSAWLMAFDSSLRFLFPPIEFPGKHGGATAYRLKGRTSDYLAVMRGNPEISANRSVIGIYSVTGTLIRERLITEPPEDCTGGHFLPDPRDSSMFGLLVCDGSIYQYDTSLQCRGRIQSAIIPSRLKEFDVDGDGEKEWIDIADQQDRITVFRRDYTYPVSIDLELTNYTNIRLSEVRQPGKPPLFSVFAGSWFYFLDYRFDPLYYWQWPLYLGIYLTILLFTLAVQKVQRIQTERRRRTEKKITELQLKIVRNQMDPHFTMNAINAVIAAVNREEKEQAREHLLHFSKMYRSLVLSADRIKRTLKEELDFAENYLALEKFRFGDRFSYRIEIADGVDLTRDVPKMAIQSPVENAVKHGFSPSPHPSPAGEGPGVGLPAGEGTILIHAFMEGTALVVEITDNGIGRAAAARQAGSSGTGKGMEIMEQSFALYYKVTGIHVTSEVSDLTDGQGNPAGTKVRVTIG